MAASDGPEEQERMCTVNIGQPCEYEEDRRHGNIVCIHCGFITKGKNEECWSFCYVEPRREVCR